MAGCFNRWIDELDDFTPKTLPGIPVKQRKFADDDTDELLVENRHDGKPGFWLNVEYVYWNKENRGGVLFNKRQAQSIINHLQKLVDAPVKTPKKGK